MRPFEKENCKVMYLIYIPRPFINGHKKYQFKYQYKFRWQLSSIIPETYIHGKSVPWNRGNSSRVARRLNFFLLSGGEGQCISYVEVLYTLGVHAYPPLLS